MYFEYVLDDCDQSDLFRRRVDEQRHSQTDCNVWLKSGIQKGDTTASVFSQNSEIQTLAKDDLCTMHTWRLHSCKRSDCHLAFSRPVSLQSRFWRRTAARSPCCPASLLPHKGGSCVMLCLFALQKNRVVLGSSISCKQSTTSVQTLTVSRQHCWKPGTLFFWSNWASLRSGFPMHTCLPFARASDELAGWLSKPLQNDAYTEMKPGYPGTVPCPKGPAKTMQHFASLLPDF